MNWSSKDTAWLVMVYFILVPWVVFAVYIFGHDSPPRNFDPVALGKGHEQPVGAGYETHPFSNTIFLIFLSILVPIGAMIHAGSSYRYQYICLFVPIYWPRSWMGPRRPRTCVPIEVEPGGTRVADELRPGEQALAAKARQTIMQKAFAPLSFNRLVIHVCLVEPSASSAKRLRYFLAAVAFTSAQVWCSYAIVDTIPLGTCARGIDDHCPTAKYCSLYDGNGAPHDTGRCVDCQFMTWETFGSIPFGHSSHRNASKIVTELCWKYSGPGKYNYSAWHEKLRFVGGGAAQRLQDPALWNDAAAREAASFCKGCVDPAGEFVRNTWVNIITVRAMSGRAWAVFFMCLLAFGLEVAHSIRDIYVCLAELQRHFPDLYSLGNRTQWERVMAFVLEGGQWIRISLVINFAISTIPTLVASRGGDSVSLVWNIIALAVLYKCDTLMYNAYLSGQDRRVFEATHRPPILTTKEMWRIEFWRLYFVVAAPLHAYIGMQNLAHADKTWQWEPLTVLSGTEPYPRGSSINIILPFVFYLALWGANNGLELYLNVLEHGHVNLRVADWIRAASTVWNLNIRTWVTNWPFFIQFAGVIFHVADVYVRQNYWWPTENGNELMKNMKWT